MQTKNHPATTQNQDQHHEGAALALPELPKSKGEEQQQKPELLKITREEWKKTHRDYKTIIDGQRYVLRMVSGKGTCLVPVEVVKEL